MHHAQDFYALQEQVRFDLSNSNTEALILSELFQSVPEQTDSLFNLKLNYSHPQGERSLHTEIASLYKDVQSEQVLVEEGSEEALLLLLQCLLESSDHLILQFPCYPPALEIAVNRNERQVSLWQGKIKDNRWQWDLSELETLCRQDTKAIFICSPHNPTGSVMTNDEYQRLIHFACERKLLLICDEVYRFLEYEPELRLQPISECYEWGISIGSLSKAFALPGLRTGWIVMKDDVLRGKLISYKSRTTLCNSVVTQYLAELALQQKQAILSSVSALVQQNLQHLKAFMATYMDIFDWVEPEAGTVAFIALKNRQDAESFCYDLARKASVLCLPAAMFSYEPYYFRIGFGKAHFQEALEAIAGYLKQDY